MAATGTSQMTAGTGQMATGTSHMATIVTDNNSGDVKEPDTKSTTSDNGASVRSSTTSTDVNLVNSAANESVTSAGGHNNFAGEIFCNLFLNEVVIMKMTRAEWLL